MEHKYIHLAIGSTCSKPGDVDGNLAQIVDFARRAAADGADLLLTPELSASGYGPYPEVLATAEVAGAGPIYTALAAAACETGVVICAGFVERAGEKRYLAHYVVYPDGRFIVQRKHRVTPAERPLDALVALDSSDYIGQPTEPLQFTIFVVKGVRCAITICADAGITDIDRYLAAQGVEVVLGPTGAGGELKDRVTTADLHTEAGRNKYLDWLRQVFFPEGGITKCIEYGRALAAVNQCGYDGRNFAHLGHGMVITPMGEVPALIHGLPNLDRQRPMYTHAVVDVLDRVLGL